MYIFCRARRCKMQSPRCKLHVARAGGKVSCFDMNVSFAHLSSLINIFLSLSLPLALQRLKLRYPAFLSRFLLARPYPIYPMCNVHPMCHQYLQQSISQTRDGRVTKILSYLVYFHKQLEHKILKKTDLRKYKKYTFFAHIPSSGVRMRLHIGKLFRPDPQTNKFQLKYPKNAPSRTKRIGQTSE